MPAISPGSHRRPVERLNRSASEVEAYNLQLQCKPLVFSVFGQLADASRGWLSSRC
jgi:hypothetical protein